MRGQEVRCGPDWNDLAWIDGPMAFVIVTLNVLHIHCSCDTRQLKQFAGVSPQVWIIDDPAAVALEVPVINLIEPHQCGEHPDVRLG